LRAAKESGLFDTIMVSTDRPEIAQLAQRLGAEVPFLRSSTNADDHSTTADVLLEVLDGYQRLERTFELACCCYPAAPFITASRLQQAHRLLLERNADTALLVIRYDAPIQRALRMTDGGCLKFLWPENSTTRTQDLDPAFHDAGQFYWFRTASFLAHRALFSAATVGLEIPTLEAQDIDTEQDWKIAELKYTLLHGGHFA
jgi:N-acylneuraminate cytidylyltransferase